jgi:predicted alpha/beta hydrolase
VGSYRVVTADGYAIAVERHDAKDEGGRADVAGVAIVASAMGVTQSFYAPFARWLAAQGVATYTFDYRGVGESAPPEGTLRGFRATIDDWATLDCAAVIDDASSRFPGKPIFWIGHSVGAQILGLIPNRDRVRAMLSVAAGSGYYRYNARPLRYYVLSLWAVVMPLALKLSGYFPGKRLRVVGDLPYGVAEQWRRWCLAADYLGVEGADVRDQLARVTVPITALSFQDDEMMTLRGTRALFDLYAGSKVDIQRVRPADVGVRSIGHLGFFRAKMEQTLWPMVPAWMGLAGEQALAS